MGQRARKRRKAGRALRRQAPCLYMHSSTRQAQNASTPWVYALRSNHMHDHSRFQRDIDWRHRRLSLSLYCSQKSLTHNIGSAFVLRIIKINFTLKPPRSPCLDGDRMHAQGFGDATKSVTSLSYISSLLVCSERHCYRFCRFSKIAFRRELPYSRA